MTDCHDFAKQCLAKSSPAIKKALKYLRVYGIILIFASKNPSLHKRWIFLFPRRRRLPPPAPRAAMAVWAIAKRTSAADG